MGQAGQRGRGASAGANGDARAGVLGRLKRTGLAQGSPGPSGGERGWAVERENGLGCLRSGRGGVLGFLVLGLGWVSFLLLLLFLFLFKLTQSNLFEFKIEFEFNSNTQTNKSMLQHECNIKSKPRTKF